MLDQIMIFFLLAVSLSVVLNVVFKKLGISSIIGYIVTGAVLSSIFHFHKNENLTHIAEFGIVFLMFTIGLEFSLRHLMSMKKEVFINGLLQMLVTGSVFACISKYVFGFETHTSIIIGSALALSSTAIVLKVMNEDGKIHSFYGRKVLGILLFQDIAVIPILIMINIFALSTLPLKEILKTTFIDAIIVLFLLFFIGKFLLNKILYYVVKTDSHETFIATILFIVVGASYLAHVFGFSFSLGAFLAGMLIAETKYKHQIEADLIPFRDLLMGLFFLTVGLQIDFHVFFDNIFLILIGCFLIMIIKAVLIFFILRISSTPRISIKTAISLSQVGEFAFVVFEFSTGTLISEAFAQIFVLIIVISMILTPFVLKNVGKIYDSIMTSDVSDDNDIHTTLLRDHIVVFGYGKLGQEVVLHLKRQNLAYMVIEQNLDYVRLGKSRNEPVFFGNAMQKSILDFAQISATKAIIIAVENEEKLRLLCESIISYNKNLNIVVAVSDYQVKDHISDLNINHVLNASKEIGKTLVNEALICKRAEYHEITTNT